MLYLLTGDVQTGKTRWLTRLIEQLSLREVPVFGVLSPGVWIAQVDQYGEPTFEKTGIEAALLPTNERLTFARRRDLVLVEGCFNPVSQSACAGLGWEIDEGAIARINRHFDEIAASAKEGQSNASHGALDLFPFAPSAHSEYTEFSECEPLLLEIAQGILVVDELGQLELLHNQGFTSALALLEAGATARYQHALVVVRDWLCERARGRFAPAWNGVQVLTI